jgi:hypothetical protein
MNRTRWRLLVACLVAVGVVVGAAGGGNGTRDAAVTFKVVPGPGRATYAENFANTATFQWKGTSQPTQVQFRQTRPVATFEGNSYPSRLVAASCNVVWDGDVATCAFGKATSAKVTTVWEAPTIPSATGCDACVATTGRFVVKEGVPTGDTNDSFPPNGITATVTLLAGDGSDENDEAGGYEMQSCTNPLGPGSLRTNQALSLANLVSSTVCEPLSLSGADGLATTIQEGPRSGGPGHPYLGQVTVCIASLGQNCGLEGSYTPHDFGANPFTIVIRVLDDGLNRGDSLSTLYHNGFPLPLCADDPNFAHGCAISEFKRSTGPGDKIWTGIGRARTNGPWGA